MRISVHAAQRFLERVMNKESYTTLDIDFAIRYLQKSLQNVVPQRKTKYFVLPEFQDYKAVYIENTLVTIVPKSYIRYK